MNKHTSAHLMATSSAPRILRVRGARENNLKNVDIDLPRDKMIVMTGVSGSGKSSLAFDTIYAEGQRRYVESLSAYARQFLEMMQKPDVDLIEGLSPAISIEQKTTSKNPRSTVGTVTEIYDYLRLLYARIGIPYSPATGLPIESQTVSQMVDQVLALPETTRMYLLAPVVRGRKGEYRKEFLDFQKRGFQRVKVDGEFYELENVPPLDKKVTHDIDVVVDRIVVRADIATRLADSVETALRLADGLCIAEFADEKDEKGNAKRMIFSEKFACPVSGFCIAEIEPRIFSFNNPHGACPQCSGLGTQQAIDPHLLVPDETLSIKQGAIAPWAKLASPLYRQTLEGLAKHYEFDLNTPWRQLPEHVKLMLIYGSGEDEISIAFDDGFRAFTQKRPFEGVLKTVEKRWKEADPAKLPEDVTQYMAVADCGACGGYRLRAEARAVKITDKHIGHISRLSVRDAYNWFSELPNHLGDQHNQIAARILKEIRERLQFLVDVGLEYLSLSRSAGTLSGGESQRIRLASQIGSGLTGVLYVLDEPSIGLHQRDNERLLQTLVRLRDLGNTVIVVEHDEDAIRIADYVVDVGIGAGVHGGTIIAHGTPQEVMDNPDSITGKYLTGELSIKVPTQRRKTHPHKQIRVTGARGNNLRNVDANIPVGTFTCVTGVSGSGKSTLLLDTIYMAAARKLNGAHTTPDAHDKMEGLEFFDKVIDIDQSPIGRTPRSNPATYTGAFTPIRDWFSDLPESKARGYEAGRFSFNVKGGRCEACQGDGVIQIEMHFLPDVYVTCEQCKGKRYNRETLEITYKTKSISDVLNMTVDEGVEYFSAVPMIRKTLETLQRVGLGYIKIGQQATTLSGGEAQRVKLAKELARRATGRTLYILDEPTTGLHFHDVAKLLEVLHELVDNGNTVIVIEHNMEVIKTADWVVDVGPEGGDGGGEILYQGVPEGLVDIERSHTARFLKPLLKRSKKSEAA